MTEPLHLTDARAARCLRSLSAPVYLGVAAVIVLLAVGCGEQEDPAPSRPVSPGSDTSGEWGDADLVRADTGDTGSDTDAQEGSGSDADGATCSEGTSTCSAGSLETCEEGERTRVFTCAEDCGSASTCSGDSCEAAIVADVSSGSAIVIEGDQQAYTTQWNAQGRDGCSLYEEEEAGPTEGPEIFFRLTGHQVGDAVMFDAEDGGSSYAFYVIGSCDAATCLDSGVHDDDFNNLHTWQASTQADVWVAAEVFGPPRDRPFRIEIRRE